MRVPVRTSAPAATPVSLTEAKMHLRVDHSTEDALITMLIEAAVTYLDGYSGVLGRAMVTQTWRQDFDAFGHCLRLPLLAASIVSVKWLDADGDEHTIEADDYSLITDALGSYVQFVAGFAFPSDVALVQVTFTAGYGNASAVPAALKAAILLLVGHWYQNREAVGEATQEPPLAVSALIAPFRRLSV